MKTYTSFVSALLFIAVTFISFSSFAVTHTVLVGNFYFNPSTISNVQIGDIIHWQWVEGSHTTTSTTIPAGAAPWDSPMNSGSQVFDYTVTVAGVYNYKCTPHASIQFGSFTVSGAAPTLNVTPGNQNVSSGAGNTSFSITSNSAWNASSNKTWCTVSPSSGNGNGTLAVTFEENTSTSVRIATITVSVSGLSPEMVTVTQSGAVLTLVVTPEEQEVTSSSGVATFDVISNTDWTAESDASWCTVSPSGSGNGILTATYTENTSADEREAKITVTGNGGLEEEVKVKQDGSSLGVEYNSKQSFALYPNPTSCIFTLIPGQISNVNMETCLLDITGKVLKTEILSGSQSYQWDISNLPEGIYFIRVKDGDAIVTKRLVKSN